MEDRQHQLKDQLTMILDILPIIIYLFHNKFFDKYIFFIMIKSTIQDLQIIDFQIRIFNNTIFFQEKKTIDIGKRKEKKTKQKTSCDTPCHVM